jgi:serine phosphatase RsbU (regulator of sigma subunit)
VAPDGRFRPRFGRFPPQGKTSAVDLFRKGFDPAILAGKVVLIGTTGAGTSDVAVTPTNPQAYGLHVQAQAVDAIFKHAFLVRPPVADAMELAFGLALALIAVIVLPRLRRVSTSLLVPLTTVAAIVAASWIAFAVWGVLLDPLPPILIGSAAGLAVLVAMFSETALAQRRLRLALVQERVGAARTSGELDAARDIQLGMLPTPSLLARLDPAVDLAAMLEPARAVGGDFYDAFRLGDGRVAFVVGDVTGKGVPAALFMALSKALARAVLTASDHDLARGFADLDAELSRDNSQDMFVTMLVGALDTETGRVEFINAGHENPLVVRAGGRIEEFVMVGGPPLCVATGFPYAIEAMTLEVGEGLVLTTDGVAEARTAGDDFFERERLVDTLAALDPAWRAADATAAVKQAVRAFEAGAEPSDDLTVLALRRRRQ